MVISWGPLKVLPEILLAWRVGIISQQNDLNVAPRGWEQNWEGREGTDRWRLLPP